MVYFLGELLGALLGQYLLFRLLRWLARKLGLAGDILRPIPIILINLLIAIVAIAATYFEHAGILPEGEVMLRIIAATAVILISLLRSRGQAVNP